MTFAKKIPLFLAATCVVAAVGVPAAAAGRSDASSLLLRAVNSTRVAYGLRPLRLDTTLARAARAHSTDMLRNGYFAHGAFATRMLGFHVRGPFVGENLAWGTGSLAGPEAIVGEWLRSPEHRANLLRPGFVRIGIGEAQGTFLGNGGAVVVTADFAGS